MNSTSTGSSALAKTGFGGTLGAGYGMYVGNTAGCGCGNNGYASNGYNSNTNGNSNGNNGGGANLAFGQAAGGNGAFARFNPLQAPNQNAAAVDTPDSPPLELPSRSWTNGDGEVVVEGQFVGLLDGKVVVRKPAGGVSLVTLDQLSDSDQQYVASVAGHKATLVVAASE